MELFAQEMDQVDPSIPKVWAGCLTAKGWKAFYPMGGGGTIFRQGSIARLLKPTHCSVNTNTTSDTGSGARSVEKERAFERQVCDQLQANKIDEASSYAPGMSVSDLMGAVFGRHHNCYHSDWLVGIFINYYSLSVEQWDDSNLEENNGEAWIHPFVDSLEWAMVEPPPKNWNRPRQTGSCPYIVQAGHCDAQKAHVCHYVNPETMERLVKEAPLT